jgi:UDP-2-acetamido-2-deoxy-ribo-hexuluronate aminotransferase
MEPAVTDRFEHAVTEAYALDGFHVTMSGRQALKIALELLELQQGSYVAHQSYVCPAVTDAVMAAGLRPWLVDVDEHWQMSARTIRRSNPPDLGAIILSPPFGIAPDVEGLSEWECCKIMDACQMSPAGIKALDHESADLLVTSFHPTKYIPAFGGGIASLNHSYDARLKVLSSMEREFAPYPSLYAALGILQLENLDEIELRRDWLSRRMYAAYPEVFEPIMQACGRQPARLMRFPAQLAKPHAKRAIARLNNEGIAARHGVDTLIHRLIGLHDELFPNSCKLFERTVSLPFHPSLNGAEQDRVVAAVHSLKETG